jgi:LmbE family N-acetylglucosaminyl deacetylase
VWHDAGFASPARRCPRGDAAVALDLPLPSVKLRGMGIAPIRRAPVLLATLVLVCAPALGALPKAAALKGLRRGSARVLVFAPHPDDEALGAAGLIQRVVRGNGAVRVVFITSGDGFPPGVTREVHSQHPSAEDFRAYARRREDEAVRSLGTLGVPRDDIVFLGFPDQGLCPIRRLHRADRPPYYRSPFTAADRPPPADALVRNAEYDVADLERELRRVIVHFRPTLVLVPHWADTHPDHCTTYFLVRDALQDVEADLPGLRPDVVGYLIHFDGWPDGTTSALAPPRGFPVPANWVAFPLSPREAAIKRDAIGQYRTQMEVMAGYLLGFVRRNELFALDADRLAPGAEEGCCGGSGT